MIELAERSISLWNPRRIHQVNIERKEKAPSFEYDDTISQTEDKTDELLLRMGGDNIKNNDKNPFVSIGSAIIIP